MIPDSQQIPKNIQQFFCTLTKVIISVSQMTSITLCSPQSGRRSDSITDVQLDRREVTYSDPPRARDPGDIDHGGGQEDDHFIPTAPSVYSKSYQHQQQHRQYKQQKQHQSSNIHVYETPQKQSSYDVTTNPPVSAPIIPDMDNARHQMNISKSKQVG